MNPVCICAECDRPATHRSSLGQTFCTEHAAESIAPAWAIKPERPDPQGWELLGRALRHQLGIKVLGEATRERIHEARGFSAETAEYLFKGLLGVLLIPVAWALVVLVLPWKAIEAIWLSVRTPEEVRRALRILDGLPVPPRRPAGCRPPVWRILGGSR